MSRGRSTRKPEDRRTYVVRTPDARRVMAMAATVWSSDDVDVHRIAGDTSGRIVTGRCGDSAATYVSPLFLGDGRWQHTNDRPPANQISRYRSPTLSCTPVAARGTLPLADDICRGDYINARALGLRNVYNVRDRHSPMIRMFNTGSPFLSHLFMAYPMKTSHKSKSKNVD